MAFEIKPVPLGKKLECAITFLEVAPAEPLSVPFPKGALVTVATGEDVSTAFALPTGSAVYS